MFSPYHYHSLGVKVGAGFLNRLWWRLMPGVIIKVRWPVGEVVITEDDPRWDWTIGPSKYLVESADPNDHYRHWMEKNVGKQGWDWDWTMMHNDIAENKLTIKFRNGKKAQATIAALRWS